MPKRKPKASEEAVEEGVVYVAASGSYYSKPQIDAKKIRDCTRNNYLADQVAKLRAQIFTERYMIEVRDPKDEIDEELQTRELQMFEAKDVSLWTRMQQTWEDVWYWGPALFNPVWEMEGSERVLTKLRRLPPNSFAQAPMGVMTTYSEILQGVVLNDQGEIEWWQSPSELDMRQVQLSNVFMVTDPTSTELAGTSKIIPLVPLITMLDFCWQAQMQKVNRVGAPTLFIKVMNPVKNATRDDVAYANIILKSWGKGTAYQLRENMEVVELDITDNEAALNTIEALKTRIREFFAPAALMQKEGDTIGGNAAAEKDLFDMWIEGQHQWVEDAFSALAQEYLDSNGYEGYTARVRIGAQNVGIGELEAKQAQVGFQTQALTVNEIRRKLGEVDLSEEELAKLAEAYSRLIKQQSGPGFPFVMKEHDLEHMPGVEEKAYDLRLKRLYDDLSDRVIGALHEEE